MIKYIFLTFILITSLLLAGCQSGQPRDKNMPAAKAGQVSANKAGTQASPVIEYFQATPSSINAGGFSTLSWSVSDATELQLNNEAGNVPLSGTRVVYPVSTTTYTLTASNSAGSKNATTQVQVSNLPVGDSPPVINYFGLEPEKIIAGETTVLRWDILNAASVSIQPGIGNVAQVGKQSLTPSSTTSYKLVASNINGMVTAAVPVTVLNTKPFNVTKVEVTEGPSSSPSICPLEMEYTGLITTNGPCVVTYRWEQSNGVMGPTQSLTFYGADTYAVNHSWTIGTNGNYSVRLRTLTPNEIASISFAALITCKDIVVKSIQPATTTGAGVVACPASVSFSADITVDGPGTVTYRWEQSDGVVSKDMTATFTKAGTQTLTYSFDVNKSGTYWARVRTLKPKVMTASSYTSIIVTCESIVTLVVVTDATASGRPCPSTVTFSGSITVNGPGKVSYCWQQSDGVVTPARTLTFPSAGTQCVTHSWSVNTSGTYSAILTTITPTSLSSENGATVIVTCEY
jgi:hypothetical protein